MMTHLRRAFGALLALAAVVLSAQVVSATPAAATGKQYCWDQIVTTGHGTTSYVKRCRTVQPGEKPGPGGQPSLADCGLDKYTPGGGHNWYCVGTSACYIDDTAHAYDGDPGPPPPGQEWHVRVCYPCARCLGPPGIFHVLGGAAARPPIVQAQEAFGRLEVTHGKPSHSPTTKAVVGLTTWFWVDPGLFTETRGTSAEGLVAIATPTSTVWDPGDGSGTVTCDGPGRAYAGSEDAAGACTHTYRSSSPDYHGQVTRHWTVRYEDGGAVVNIPGAPLALDLADGFDLAVVETQVVDDRGGN